MSVKHLHHVTLAVPDVATQKLFYEDFGLIGKSVGDRVVLRCKGRNQDQVIVIPGKNISYMTSRLEQRKQDWLTLKRESNEAPIQHLNTSPKQRLMTEFGCAISSTICCTTSMSVIQLLDSGDPNPPRNLQALM